MMVFLYIIGIHKKKKSIHGYFPKSLVASSKNVDDTVLKESVRLKDVRFVLFSMLIISNKEVTLFRDVSYFRKR